MKRDVNHVVQQSLLFQPQIQQAKGKAAIPINSTGFSCWSSCIKSDSFCSDMCMLRCVRCEDSFINSSQSCVCGTSNVLVRIWCIYLNLCIAYVYAMHLECDESITFSILITGRRDVLPFKQFAYLCCLKCHLWPTGKSPKLTLWIVFVYCC